MEREKDPCTMEGMTVHKTTKKGQAHRLQQLDGNNIIIHPEQSMVQNTIK